MWKNSNYENKIKINQMYVLLQSNVNQEKKKRKGGLVSIWITNATYCQ